ncbi:short chain dehydrogenase [Paraglaciecola polaris]|uniref:Short chain dehydrogenase n=1 Tax=Paraglaciecola polaris LMG 21857 TaxID=1129793 RepID=K6YP72_9ALTE|nr:short chain dehydrogenase [Paraglaciecola polaris]GAC34519.1 short chain dehydrogenase [Paraglaciecola polaris LMG 21857]
MKIVLIGATGMIGKAVSNELKEHEIISAGFKNGQYQVDIENRDPIEAMFEDVGQVDAVTSTTGLIAFAPLNELTIEQFRMTINNKILGHINLLQIASQYIRDGGSITFTSGYVAQNPMPGSSSVSLVNAALDAFVKAAALELGSKLRINTVSPRFIKDNDDTNGYGQHRWRQCCRYSQCLPSRY